MIECGGLLVPLIIELGEQSQTPSDPMVLREARLDGDGHNKVGRVAGGGEHPPAVTRLVNGTAVPTTHLNVRGDTWFEPNVGHGGKQFLGLCLCKLVPFLVPFSTIQIQPVAVDAIVWTTSNLML